MKLLNLGCGLRTHPDWCNVDLVAATPGVVEHDLLRGLPFADDSWDAVYHSHVLEHLTPADARRFVSDCFRVLKPGGVIRIAVPDLQRIARAYLTEIEKVLAGSTNSRANLEWMHLELLDQMVRYESGGEMQRFANDQALLNRPFIESRVGGEPFAQTTRVKRPKKRLTLQRVSRWITKLRRSAARAAVTLIAGRAAAEAFREGLFRQSGQVHRWMYDQISLSELLGESGFTGVRPCEATESRIERFADYELDTCDGQVRKPDSLFIEGVKPSAAGRAAKSAAA